ncbi:LAMI_0F06920g1_1 [Lachancea mirantina]|uniref:LAMI_0F06920g1_1 n=1 Tax=Lachancea mirantina TaxID=1230905 RepID=A0A1G4JZA7_9SACH|nr:LAMI_0F06920g1_1 [Lachancea mirantina]
MESKSESESKDSLKLTEANLAAIQADSQVSKVKGDTEDDRSSILSKIEFNHPDDDVGLSEYCVSSDAETEKMDEESLNRDNAGHPSLKELAHEARVNDIKSDEALETNNTVEEEHDKELKNEALEKSEIPSLTDSVSNELPTAFVSGSENSADLKVEFIAEKVEKAETADTAETETTNTADQQPLISKLNYAPEGEPDDVTSEVADDEEAVLEEAPDVVDTAVATAQPLEKGIIKRPADENREGSDNTQFKKPRLPSITGPSGAQENEEEDNDADEDEDEIEDEDHEHSKLVSKKRSPIETESEEQSPMEQENVRKQALQEMIDIEHQFADLRQRLYENKLAKLQTESQMCLEGSHPSLQTYYQKIDFVRDHKLRRAYQRQRYELECIDKETRATRCAIHQDFMRKVTDLKHELLAQTTQRWYDINKERREMDVVVPEMNYHVPVKLNDKTLSCITGYAAPAHRRREGELLAEDLECEGIRIQFKSNPVDKLEVIVDRMRFNNELSDLEGLKRYFSGFPGAPSLSSLKDSEVFDDLQRLSGKPAM